MATAAPALRPARRDWLGLGAAAFQLAIILLLVRRYALEGDAFFAVALLAAAGFAVHAFLPRAAKLPFFAALSIASIVITLGLAQGAWLLGIGLVLIGLCHAPVPFRARIALVVVAGAALALVRTDRVHAPWSPGLWPILGSMFMFRMIVYLYDIRHEKTPPTAARTLAYFFMLPNVCFPLFPIVDYKTFRRTHLEGEERWVLQTGIHWMVRGVAHLILYRIVYYNLALGPSEIAGRGDLIRFLVTNFLLYLRVSGQFHLIVGMLHLFGFNLPETNKLYVLANGFTDFWRRINIYWKEFMMKIFYYPIYFRVKKLGTTVALTIATLGVFVVTWALHSYQWFWLRGDFPVTAQDVLFWSVLAVLVLIGSLREAGGAKGRPPGWRPRNVREAAGLVVKTVGTFAAICVLWSLWSAATVSDWIDLWKHLGAADVACLLGIPFAAAAIIASSGGTGSAAAGSSVPGSATPPRPRAPAKKRSFTRAVAATTAVASLLLALSLGPVARALGPVAAETISSVRSSRLNRRDAERMERGYYENLLGANTFDSELWRVLAKRPAVRPFAEDANAVRVTNDYLGTELIPSLDISHFGTRLTTNRWGMRDRDYAVEKSAGTFRIAILGSSHVMGMGVGDRETFENIVEARLNGAADSAAARVEMLNFAVGGYSPLEQIAVVQDRARQFSPDVVVYFAHANDLENAVRRLGVLVRTGVDVRYDFLRDVVARAHVTPKSGEAFVKGRLARHGEEIVGGLYRELAAEARRQGAVPVWVFLPRVSDDEPIEKRAVIQRLAAEAGFQCLSMENAYAGSDLPSLYLAEWDQHPNAAGHRLLAADFERVLRASNGVLPPDVLARVAAEPR